jgi:hypothetical protein
MFTSKILTGVKTSCRQRGKDNFFIVSQPLQVLPGLKALELEIWTLNRILERREATNIIQGFVTLWTLHFQKED